MFISSLCGSWWLNPIGELLINCFKWTVSLGDVDARGNRLSRIGSTHSTRLEVACVFSQTNWPRALIMILVELGHPVVVMFRQDWSHFKVCSAHLASKLQNIGLLVTSWDEALSADVLVDGLNICLCNSHHGVFVGWCPQIDVGLSKLVSKTGWFGTIFSCKCLCYESLLRLRSVCASLAKVDRIGWFLELRSFCVLPRDHLALSNLIIGLALSGCRLLNSMAISKMKVASLDSFTLFPLLVRAANECMCGRGLIHSSRGGLRRGFVDAQGEMWWPKISSLLGYLVTDISVGLCLVSWAFCRIVIAILLECCKRFIVICWANMTDLHLVDVGSPLFRYSIFVCITLGHFVWRCWSFGSFKLVALFKAHFEIMLSLGSFVCIYTSLVNHCDSWLLHAALVLTQVVHLVASERKVGFGWADASDNLISFLSALHNCLSFISAWLCLGETFLSCALRHIEILRG